MTNSPLSSSSFSKTALRPLSSTRPMILVAAAVLIDEENRVLLAQRPKGKSMAGLWEFPGGKVHEHELPEDALVRELHEELDIIVGAECLFPMTFTSYPYPEFHLLMPIYGCHTWQGVPHPLEGQKLAWAKKSECSQFAMPPADKQILHVLLELI